ncbi:MAG: reverse transcriptase [Bacteroidales bacterium]|nr:reverse transcriptase [Bacteroidales bacterium]
MMRRVLHNPLNGRFTTVGADLAVRRSYEDAIPQEHSNYWSSTEYNSNNAWNVNFNSGNVNNNNKYNSNVARPVAALDGLFPDFALFFETVLDAYRDCLKGKMSSPQAIEYMKVADIDLPVLAWELWTGTYKPTTSTCFLVHYPKLREVFAAAFRDRIVHHWICMRLIPLFEERFVSQGNVSFNCRKGFGTQKAVEAVSAGFERVSEGYTKRAWVFRGDLVGFFMGISKSRLWYLLGRFIRRYYHGDYKDILLRVTEQVVMHHPERDCVFNTDPREWLGLSMRKSMFTCGDDRGEPIGNHTTQQFANFLLSFLDAHVLFLFRHKNFDYERFVDDFEITCDDLPFLMAQIPKIERFLSESLLLELHKDKRYIQPVAHGLKFVGSFIKPHRTYLSNVTIARFRERVHGFGEMMMERELDTLDCQRIEQVINSYLGFCRMHRTYNLRKEILGQFPSEFFRYFYIRNNYETIRTKAKYRPLTVSFDMAA